MGFLSALWSKLGGLVFPETPKRLRRRRLRRLEADLRRHGVLSRQGRLAAGWLRSLRDLQGALEPFRPLLLKTFGSPQANYRQVLSRRFWEGCIGPDFADQRALLAAEPLSQTLLASGNVHNLHYRADVELAALLDAVRLADRDVATQEWEALRWFAELGLFPFDAFGKWSAAGGAAQDADPQPLADALADLHVVVSALDVGRTLENAVVRFCASFYPEDQLERVHAQVQRVRLLVVGPCNPLRLADLLRWLSGDPLAQPPVGRPDAEWFERQQGEFERLLRSDVDKAVGKAYNLWVASELQALFGGTEVLVSPGYSPEEDRTLQLALQLSLRYVSPLTLFKTFFYLHLKNGLLPLLHALLVKGVFGDKELNRNLTYWLAIGEQWEDELRELEAGLVGGEGSWPDVALALGHPTLRHSATTLRQVENLNHRVFEFLTATGQQVVNLLELGTLLEKDRREGKGGVVNWAQLADKAALLEALPETARRFFRLLKASVPVHSSMLDAGPGTAAPATPAPRPT